MEGNVTENARVLDPEQALAKTAILSECGKLAAAGVTFVAVHFDGCGDDGVTEEVKCFNSAQTSRARRLVPPTVL